MIIELIGLAIGAIIVLVLFALIWNSFWLWWQSILSNAPVSLIQIIFMRFRKVNPGTIVTARITARKAGIEITGDELEAHYLAGGQRRSGRAGPHLRQQGEHRAYLRP